MSDLEIGSKSKIFCNLCKTLTNHELKSIHNRRYDEHEYSYYEKIKYGFWICCGCDSASLEESFNASGMHDTEGDDIWSTVYYPKRKHSDHASKKFQKLSEKLGIIYKEVIESYNSSLNISCAIGLRALLEGVCADKGIIKGNLEKKIDQLINHLPENIVKSLHSFRFMGNEAAHELEAPNRKELKLAIEVMEDLLNFLYELDYKAKQLKKKK